MKDHCGNAENTAFRRTMQDGLTETVHGIEHHRTTVGGTTAVVVQASPMVEPIVVVQYQMNGSDSHGLPSTNKHGTRDGDPRATSLAVHVVATIGSDLLRIGHALNQKGGCSIHGRGRRQRGAIGAMSTQQAFAHVQHGDVRVHHVMQQCHSLVVGVVLDRSGRVVEQHRQQWQGERMAGVKQSRTLPGVVGVVDGLSVARDGRVGALVQVEG